MLVKAIFFRMTALASAAAAVFFVSRYPLGWLAPSVLLGAYAVLLWHRPHWWLYVLLALLPILNLYPWTGWLFVEEFDLAVLTTLAIGYLRAHSSRPSHSFTPLGALAVIALTFSYIASALLPLRGMPQFGWETLATYNTPVNALRVLKGWAWPLLLLPLLRRAADAYGSNFSQVVAKGMLSGLAIVSLVVLWERNAFPGLMNFSADYRTIGPFFEAHVGGAALDGYLALSLPFALVLLLEARSLRSIATSAGLLMLGAYASFATFSRGLYLGIALAIVVIAGVALLQRRQGAASPQLSGTSATTLVVALLVCAFLLAQVFATGGYRTLAAALGFYAGAIYVGGLTPIFDWKRSLILLAAFSMLTVAFVQFVPKGAYVIYAVSVATLAATGYLERVGRVHRLEISLAAWCWVGINTIAIGWYWGGPKAMQDGALAVVVAAMLALYNRRSAAPLWSLSWRTATLTVGGGLLLAISIPVVGNYYMQGRLRTVAHDLEAREFHWQSSIDMRGADLTTSLLGAGLGTYPERYFWHNEKGNFPGIVAFKREHEHSFVRLGQPRSGAGRSTEPLRFSQRVPIEPERNLTLQLTLRSQAPKTTLRVNVCEKWLLYSERCSRTPASFRPKPGEWQTFTADLSTGTVGSIHWWGKRPTLLSMAVDGRGIVMDVSDVRLIDPSRGDLLENGDMTSGGDRWFFTSDHSHLPWHTESLWLGIWFDQGWFGFASFMAVLAAGLAACLHGSRAASPAAVARLAGVAGFLMVGLFSTLLDATRLAVAFYLLLFTGMLSSRRVAGADRGRGKNRSRRKSRATGRRPSAIGLPPQATNLGGASVHATRQ